LSKSNHPGWAPGLKNGLLEGLRRGWDGFVWMLKILLPVSFLTFVIEWTGVLQYADAVVGPAMALFRLPASAAVPLAAGLLTGIYGGIAAMSVLPLTVSQMTLVALFLLISHNLIQEGIIQGKSGLHPLKATLWRIGASAVTVWWVGFFLELPDPGVVPASMAAAAGPETFGAALSRWSAGLLRLSGTMFLIIVTLMILMSWLKIFRLVDRTVVFLAPLLRLLGLERSVGMLWLTATVFGISYGGALIVQEAEESGLSAQELERLHVSIGMHHSMIEDPAVFLPFGIHAFWLWVPRLLAAVAAVRLYDFYQRCRRRKVRQA
jgi:hypothetical protein